MLREIMEKNLYIKTIYFGSFTNQRQNTQLSDDYIMLDYTVFEQFHCRGYMI